MEIRTTRLCTREEEQDVTSQERKKEREQLTNGLKMRRTVTPPLKRDRPVTPHLQKERDKPVTPHLKR